MIKNQFLQGLEKKAWQTNYEDGLFDLYFGFLLLGNASAALIDVYWGLTYAGSISLIVLTVLGTALVFAGKRFITIPRIGKMTVGPFRLKRIVILTIVIGLAVISTLLLWVFPTFLGSRTDSIPVIPIYFFVFIGLIFGSIAWLMDFKRGYIIALIFALSWGLNELFIFLGNSRAVGGLIFELGGFFIIVMGIFFFVKFLKQHPSPGKHSEGKAVGE